MKRIPHAREVDQAIRATQAALKQARKGISQMAGQLMAKGDFDGAEALVAKGREIQQFEAEVQALRARWRELRGGRGSGQKTTKTAQWLYYQPILKALAAAGGKAPRAELEPEVERLMKGTLQPGDRDPMARGLERWQMMIRRARKHLASEGWLEEGSGPVWRITAAGRRAAERPAGVGQATTG